MYIKCNLLYYLINIKQLFDELVEILDPDINPIDEDYSEDETETEKSDSTCK